MTGELFLAWKYLKPKKTLTSLITYLSILGPILGVGVLIVVLSVMNGFSHELKKKFFDYEAHIAIGNYGRALNAPEKLTEYLKKKHHLKASPGSALPVFLQFKDKTATKALKGLLPQYDSKVTKIRNSMIEGRYEVGRNEAIIGNALAFSLGIKVGDTVILHSPQKYGKLINQLNNTENKPLDNEIETRQAVQVKVIGIFSLGLYKIDNNLIFMHLDSVNDMLTLDWGTAQYVDVFVDEPMKVQNTIQTLKQDPKLANLAYFSWIDKNRGFFDVLAKEKKMMMFVLFFIEIGAALGIGATLFTLVLQKTKEIGIMKATGVSGNSIISIFLIQGTVIGFIGTVSGLIGGLTILRFRDFIAKIFYTVTGSELLPKQFYELSSIPMVIIPSDIILITCGSILICIIGALLPAIAAAAVKPTTALNSDN